MSRVAVLVAVALVVGAMAVPAPAHAAAIRGARAGVAKPLASRRLQLEHSSRHRVGARVRELDKVGIGSANRAGVNEGADRMPPPLLPVAVRSPQPTASPFLATSLSAASSLKTLKLINGTDSISDPLDVAPPDTQVAVGPSYIVEAVNDALSVWTKSGSFVGSADLNGFFSVPEGDFSDPRILYDAATGRWLLSGAAADGSFDSETFVAVSDSNDPTGNWTVYGLVFAAGVLMDQPTIGVSTDKVVISWDDFANSGFTFTGAETLVLQFSDLLAGVDVNFVRTGPDPSRHHLVPVTSLSATTTQYVVYNNSCSFASGFGSGSCTTGTPSLGVMTITGTPLTHDVAWAESDPSITQTAAPGIAEQPDGAPGIQMNDDRLLSAVWRNGVLWTGGNDLCVIGGAVHGCERLIKVITTGGPSVEVDGDIGIGGEDVSFPAVALDGAADVYVVSTVSSSSIYPSVLVLVSTPSSGSFSGSVVKSGASAYRCSFCGTPSGRWGDYSGAAIDPANPAVIWGAGEYATFGTTDNWGTAIAEVAVTVDTTPPTVSMSEPHHKVSLSTAFTVKWSGSDGDGGTGIARYQVQSATARWDGSFGSWSNWQTSTTATSAVWHGSAGHTYCFRVRAFDGTGNASGWSQRCTSVPLVSGNLSYASGWSTSTSTKYYGGAARYTVQGLAKATRTHVEAKHVWLVVTKCAACGTVQVRWNDHVEGTFTLTSSTTMNRQLIAVLSFSSVQDGTLTLYSTTSGKKVILEGLDVFRE